MTRQIPKLAVHTVSTRKSETLRGGTAGCVSAVHISCSRRWSNCSAENSHSKRRSIDAADDSGVGDTRGYNLASTSALAAAPGAKRGTPPQLLLSVNLLKILCVAPHPAKRAETRDCPICREHIPLRLLGQHYTLEISRVQTILDHVGDLEGFSDPHPLAHTPYVHGSLYLPRRRHAATHVHIRAQPHT